MTITHEEDEVETDQIVDLLFAHPEGITLQFNPPISQAKVETLVTNIVVQFGTKCLHRTFGSFDTDMADSETHSWTKLTPPETF